MAKKIPITSFSDQFAELEGIVQWFEQGAPDLDKGLEQFKRATILSQALKQRLTEAENQITLIRDMGETGIGNKE